MNSYGERVATQLLLLRFSKLLWCQHNDSLILCTKSASDALGGQLSRKFSTKLGCSQTKHALGGADVLAHACTTLTAVDEYATTSQLYAPASPCLCALLARSSQAAVLGNSRPTRVGPYMVSSCMLTLLHIMTQTACNTCHSIYRPASATSCMYQPRAGSHVCHCVALQLTFAICTCM